MSNWFVIISGTIWTAHKIKERGAKCGHGFVCFETWYYATLKGGQWLEKLVSNPILLCFHFQINNKKQIRREIVEQNEIWHSFVLSLCQGHLPHLLPVSKGPSSKWQPSEIFWNCKMLTLQEFLQWVVYNILEAKAMIEILHKWFVQILQYQIYAMNNELSVPGEGGQLKLQRRQRPIWVVQRRALVSEVLEQSERCEVSNQFFCGYFQYSVPLSK